MPRSASRRALASSMNASSRNKPHALLDRHVFGVQLDADDEADETDERFGELSELDARILTAEAGLDHHLLAVVRPAFDERRRREHDRLARLRLDPAQMLVVQEVARDRPRGSRSTRASG